VREVRAFVSAMAFVAFSVCPEVVIFSLAPSAGSELGISLLCLLKASCIGNNGFVQGEPLDLLLNVEFLLDDVADSLSIGSLALHCVQDFFEFFIQVYCNRRMLYLIFYL
jgi:hypothetical protein